MFNNRIISPALRVCLACLKIGMVGLGGLLWNGALHNWVQGQQALAVQPRQPDS